MREETIKIFSNIIFRFRLTPAMLLVCGRFRAAPRVRVPRMLGCWGPIFRFFDFSIFRFFDFSIFRFHSVFFVLVFPKSRFFPHEMRLFASNALFSRLETCFLSLFKYICRNLFLFTININ